MAKIKRKPFILCIVGASSAGKTSLIERLIPELRKRGLKIGTIKHDIHDRFEMDKPGKDSWRHKKAGASVTIVSSPRRIGIIMDVDHDHDPEELLKFLDVDLVITEGYKKSPYPKIEIIKTGIDPICKDDKTLIAIVSDNELLSSTNIPRFTLQDIEKLADFVIKYFHLLNSS